MCIIDLNNAKTYIKRITLLDQKYHLEIENIFKLRQEKSTALQYI